jgi:general secretion pathway protein K
MNIPHLQNERGLALVITLLVVVLLTTLILELDSSTRTDLLAAVNFRDGTKATYLAQSGISAAKAVLRDDARHSGAYDAFDELWAIPFPAYPVGDGTVTVSIQDEGGKLNPNHLVNTSDQPVEKKVLQMRRLFELLEVDPDLVNAIVDWIDQNGEVSLPEGAEDNYYGRLEEPYHCKNDKLSLLSELHMIRGITDEVYENVSPYLTIHSDPPTGVKQGPININTAEAVVLQTLPTIEKDSDEFHITEDLAQSIMEARPIRQCKDLDKVAGISQEIRQKVENYCITTSNYFTVISSGDVSGLVKTVRAVLKRQGNRVDTVFWKIE